MAGVPEDVLNKYLDVSLWHWSVNDPLEFKFRG